MKEKNGITVVEVAFVIVIISFALAIFLPALKNSHKPGPSRANCLSNLKQLTMGWTLYADVNNEKIVNGQAYNGWAGTNDSRNNNEPYWTGDDIADVNSTKQLPEKVQIKAIKSGALFPYTNNISIYKCYHGEPGAMRTYSIVDSMNGRARNGTTVGGKSVKVGRVTLYIKNRMEITSHSSRIIFVDMGRPTAGSIAVYYDQESWFDPLRVRHSEGITLSFADGHSDYHKWMGQKTIENGRKLLTEQQINMQPESEADFQDLYWFQKGVWGELGYEPNSTPK